MKGRRSPLLETAAGGGGGAGGGEKEKEEGRKEEGRGSARDRRSPAAERFS